MGFGEFIWEIIGEILFGSIPGRIVAIVLGVLFEIWGFHILGSHPEGAITLFVFGTAFIIIGIVGLLLPKFKKNKKRKNY